MNDYDSDVNLVPNPSLSIHNNNNQIDGGSGDEKVNLQQQQQTAAAFLQASELLKMMSKLSANCFDQCVQKISSTRRTQSLPSDAEVCAKNCAIKHLTSNVVLMEAIRSVFPGQEE